MTSLEVNLTRVIKSRGVTWIVILLSLAVCFTSFSRYLETEPKQNFGLFIWSPQFWISSRSWIFFINILGSFMCAFLMVAINRTFNLLRTVSDLFVGLFFVFQATVPASMTSFSGGIILDIFVLAAMMMLFSIYQHPQQTRRIFLIFFLLAFGLLWEYGFLFYIIIFVVGCSQMRLMSLRGILALLMGLFTPIWICWGFGWVSFHNLHAIQSPDFSHFFDLSYAPSLTITIALTLFIGLITGTMNILKVLSFNNQSRIYFSFLSSIGILSGLLCLVDYANILFYSPLVYSITSMQICMYMRLYEKSRSYILFPVILIIYFIIYLWII